MVVISLSQRQLTKSEISLVSKGLKFVTKTNRIDKAKLKQELEVFGRKPRLMWHFQNEEKIFDCNKKFTPRSTFKVALSGLRQFLPTESSLKIMKNAFYFTSKPFFVLKIFNFLS